MNAAFIHPFSDSLPSHTASEFELFSSEEIFKIRRPSKIAFAVGLELEARTLLDDMAAPLNKSLDTGSASTL